MSVVPELSALQALAVAEAYVVMADKKALPEERAALVSLFGKHVSRSEMTADEIQRLTTEAFAYAAKYEFDDYLVSVEGVLTPAQAIAVFCNMYETMIVDGNVVAREKELVEKFYRFFNIDKRVVNTVRELLMVKNDTTLFLRDDHPNNGGDFRFSFVDRMDIET